MMGIVMLITDEQRLADPSISMREATSLVSRWQSIDQHLIHPVLVHIHNLETPRGMLEVAGHGGDAPEHVHYEAAHCVIDVVHLSRYRQ